MMLESFNTRFLKVSKIRFSLSLRSVEEAQARILATLVNDHENDVVETICDRCDPTALSAINLRNHLAMRQVESTHRLAVMHKLPQNPIPMKNRILGLHAVLAAWSVVSASIGLAADTSPEVPKEVAALAGAYSGSWKSFGIDAQGQVVERIAWTDTMTAERPVREGERAFVTTEDVMKFEGRPGAPFKLPGKEGYRLNRDGSLGEYFIETYGQTYRMQKLGDGVWTYLADASPQELAQLGFPEGATGRHVVVKVTSDEAGVQTDRISRVTTVHWRDKDGKERWLQYVSLQGSHRKDK